MVRFWLAVFLGAGGGKPPKKKSNKTIRFFYATAKFRKSRGKIWGSTPKHKKKKTCVSAGGWGPPTPRGGGGACFLLKQKQPAGGGLSGTLHFAGGRCRNFWGRGWEGGGGFSSRDQNWGKKWCPERGAGFWARLPNGGRAGGGAAMGGRGRFGSERFGKKGKGGQGGKSAPPPPPFQG